MGNPTPPNYLVRNCVEKAHPTYIYGGRGTLKSMNALAIAIAIASPEVSQILGYAVEDHGPVMVFDSELNANVFNSRAVALCNGLGIDKPENLYYLNAVGMHPSQSFPNLHAFCEHIQATAAVVDSFGFAVRGDPESYKDVRNHSTEYVDPLIAKGVAVILVEHKPHQGNHIFGSVAKEYHGRYIFRVEDLDGESRAKGERNTRLINEKASFTDEGQRITLLTRFEDDRIVIEPQGTTEEESEDISTADAEVKVRRSLMVSDKTTDGLAEDTGLSDTYLRNKILPDMRNRKAIHKVSTRGRGSAIVWGLRPPDDASTSSLLPREVEDGEASDTVVSDSAELDKLVDDFDQSNTIALDLETMPPPGWIWEVVGGYRAWRKKLRNKPKPERMRKVWDDLKEKTYKAYATNPATAQVRLISMATHEGLNKLVDVNPQIDIQPLLDALRNKALITHNGAFDLGVLRERYGYVHGGHVMDTQLLYVMHHYAEAGRRDKMENGMRRLPDPRDTKVDLYGTGKKDTGMSALAAVTNQYLGITMNKESQASDWSAPTLSDEQLTYALMDTKILLDLSDELVDRLSGIGMGAIVKLGLGRSLH